VPRFLEEQVLYSRYEYDRDYCFARTALASGSGGHRTAGNTGRSVAAPKALQTSSNDCFV
jgi:hypothetical protein